jgi:hypothetical protein
LHNFNIAMLARQVWCLCAKILKAHYFTDGNILNVVPTDGMSYAWRSIFGKLAMKKR